MPRRRHLLWALALAAGLAGCGQTGNSAEGFGGQERAVADVVEDLERNAQDGEQERICTQLLARELRERLPGPRCAQTVEAALDDTDEFALEVTGVRVSGRTATATVESGGGEDPRRSSVRLVREGANWRIAAFPGR